MTEKSKPFFHLAFPVADLQKTLTFYHDVLGCETGRSSDQWIDFDFWGYQVVAHLSPDEASKQPCFSRIQAVMSLNSKLFAMKIRFLPVSFGP